MAKVKKIALIALSVVGVVVACCVFCWIKRRFMNRQGGEVISTQDNLLTETSPDVELMTSEKSEIVALNTEKKQTYSENEGRILKLLDLFILDKIY